MSRILSLAILLLPATAFAADPAVTAVAYHPNGQSVVFASNHSLTLFDAADGKSRESMDTGRRITALAYAPLGRWLAVASTEAGKSGRFRLTTVQPTGNLDPGKALDIPAQHKDAIYAMAFS